MKTISVVMACYNEVDNIEEVYERVRAVARQQTHYCFEYLFIDNASEDGTRDVLRRIASADPSARVILNTRNFGHIRSPYHGLMQARGDAAIAIATDLQDPPELIADFIAKWEEGYRVVVGVKRGRADPWLTHSARRAYYSLLTRIAEAPVIRNFTGFGMYDGRVLEILRGIHDPYPYFRGLIAELGFAIAEVPFLQRVRERGATKNGFYSLFDMAMLGVTSYSRAPLRLATLLGFGMSLLSLGVSLGYVALKLLFWDEFEFGLAPLLAGLFFFGSVQLFFIGLLGEYIGAINVHVRSRPLVVESERINFP
jgi:glycosyltransferase involved in cell wall biosynthesis